MTGKKKKPDDKPRIDIGAEPLLRALKAALPFASKDQERAHMMSIRFVHDEGTEMEVNSTDGHALARLRVPTFGATEPIVFCMMTTHIPTLIKVLDRIEPKTRSETTASLEIGKFKVKLTAGETELFVPKVEEQLEFPSVEKIAPERQTTARSVMSFGMGPLLLAKALKAAAEVTHCVEWSIPTNPVMPFRLDCRPGTTGIEGFFVVMPMRLGDEESKDEAMPASMLQDASKRFHESAKSMGAKVSVRFGDEETVIADYRDQT